jgi:hypothetical protein
MLWLPTLRYRLLDYEQSPRWYGSPNTFHDLSSFDQGKTYEVVNGQKLFGSFFFLSESLVEHSYHG